MTTTQDQENLYTDLPEINIPDSDTSPSVATEMVTELAEGIKLSGSPEIVQGVLQAPVEDFLKSKYRLTPDIYSTVLKHVIARMRSYIDNMKIPVPVNPEKGASEQFQFLQTFRAALDNVDAMDAIICYDALLYMANQARDILFNERLSCRFYNRLRVMDQKVFLNVMTLVMKTMSPRQRADGLRGINMEIIFDSIANSRIKDNLVSFYART